MQKASEWTYLIFRLFRFSYAKADWNTFRCGSFIDQRAYYLVSVKYAFGLTPNTVKSKCEMRVNKWDEEKKCSRREVMNPETNKISMIA